MIPLTDPDNGRHMIDGAGGGLAQPRPRRSAGSGSTTGCPSTAPTSACCARRWPRTELDPAGVYFGTSTGQVFGSGDEGEHWQLVADFLPPIWSVEAAVIDR